jgi:hypothetical protein
MRALVIVGILVVFKVIAVACQNDNSADSGMRHSKLS